MLHEDVQMSAPTCVPAFDGGALRVKDEVHGMSVSDVP